MAKVKLKMKPFGKFVVFLLIVGPLAFYGSHALNTTSQGQSIKKWFQNLQKKDADTIQQEDSQQSTKAEPTMDKTESPFSLQDSIRVLSERITALENELDAKSEQIKVLEEKLDIQETLELPLSEEQDSLGNLLENYLDKDEQQEKDDAF